MHKVKVIVGLVISLAYVSSNVSFALTPNNHENDIQVIKILGVNDFHGQITTGNMSGGRPVGGAAVMAAYLRHATTNDQENTVIAMSGDLVGASVPASGLLDHEPSIIFLNSLANTYCSSANRMEAKCNMVAAVGNHEFDNGISRLFTLINGSSKPPKNNWISLQRYPGSVFPFLSANTVYKKTGKTVFPPYIIKNVHDVPVAFIGIILKRAAGSMLPAKAKDIKFLDESETINRYIPEIQQKGANIIVVIMHQGGDSEIYNGDTRPDIHVNGEINNIVKNLNDGVDVVMAGHTHRFLNAYLPDRTGHEVLVTEANSYSSAFAEVTLQVDKISKTVKHKSARIITTFADVYPGTQPDTKAASIVKLAVDNVAPVVDVHVGTLLENLSRKASRAGESALGNLIADSFRNSMNSNIGVTNATGMRADLKAGNVTWGDLYTVEPFGNPVVKLSFKGKDILDLLEQQWRPSSQDILQISGFSYVYDNSRPIGQRIISVLIDGKPLDMNKTYTMAVNSFLAGGGNGFSVMTRGRVLEHGSTDLDAMVVYIKSLPQPFSAKIEGRIQKA